MWYDATRCICDKARISHNLSTLTFCRQRLDWKMLYLFLSLTYRVIACPSYPGQTRMLTQAIIVRRADKRDTKSMLSVKRF